MRVSGYMEFQNWDDRLNFFILFKFFIWGCERENPVESPKNH